MSETESGTPTRQPVDLLKAYKLRVINRLSYQEIADALDVPKSSIHRALTDLVTLLPNAEQQRAYEEARPDILTAVEERMIASLVDEEAIAKASLNNRAYAFKQIHEARRLEQNKSTENVSIIEKLLDRSHEEMYKPGMGIGRGVEDKQAEVIDVASESEPVQQSTRLSDGENKTA
jgi:hypothetical protein